MAKRTKRKQTGMISRQRETRQALKEPRAIMVRPVADGQLGVFERMARDPDLTVENLGELIRYQERVEERQAVKAFDAAYREMLPEIPRIKKRGLIPGKGNYAKYEDIRRVVDPIMRRFGFTFHPRTEWPSTGVLEVVGVLEHSGGGKRESRFRTTADESGSKNAIQGLGSGVSYGKRYTLIDLLAIVCEGQDDNGQAHGAAQAKAAEARGGQVLDVKVERPAGYDKGHGDVITEKQLRRLYVISENSGRTAAEISTWLLRRFGWSKSTEITRDRYDLICSALEAPGSLS